MATTAKKRTKRRRKSSVAGSKSTTIGGIKFTKVSCHATKAAAKKKAKAIRESGYTARVVDRCVMKGRRRRKKK